MIKKDLWNGEGGESESIALFHVYTAAPAVLQPGHGLSSREQASSCDFLLQTHLLRVAVVYERSVLCIANGVESARRIVGYV